MMSESLQIFSYNTAGNLRERKRVRQFYKPGIQVNVVNSYAAASDVVSVTALRSEDFPTEGKPIKATRPSPHF